MLFSLSLADLAPLRSGCAAVSLDATVIRIEGPGAVECVQGLLTNDVVRPGPDALVYGAILTPKGMIVLDCWVLRSESECILVADRPARDPALELLRHRIPPRLARCTDLSDAWRVIWLLGPAADQFAGGDLPWPAAVGGIARDAELLVGRTSPLAAPIAALAAGPTPRLEEVERRLTQRGIPLRDAALLHASRILAGWPTLGREIGDRTLPQEARFDEIDGVSYTKGCYVGQETVARVHFRGHPNRYLRGLIWENSAPSSWIARTPAREVGRVTSALQLDGFGIGLALLRREVEPGATVLLGTVKARVTRLPFAWPAGLARPANG